MDSPVPQRGGPPAPNRGGPPAPNRGGPPGPPNRGGPGSPASLPKKGQACEGCNEGSDLIFKILAERF